MSDSITVYPIRVVSVGRSQTFEDHRGTVVSRAWSSTPPRWTRTP
jgi:hypothetical protein